MHLAACTIIRLSHQHSSSPITTRFHEICSQQDSDGDSMLLSTGILNALGGMHDHSTIPSTFIVTNNNTVSRDLLTTRLRWRLHASQHRHIECTWRHARSFD